METCEIVSILIAQKIDQLCVLLSAIFQRCIFESMQLHLIRNLKRFSICRLDNGRGIVDVTYLKQVERTI